MPGDDLLAIAMSPKPKSVPPRLGPPPQLSQLSQQLKLQAEEQRRQQKRLQPKMREVLARQAKMLARWANTGLTWKRILMSWMVLLVLTYQFFSLTALISLQVGRKKNSYYLFSLKSIKKVSSFRQIALFWKSVIKMTSL